MSGREDLDRWIEQAQHETDQLGIEDAFRLAVLLELNPPEQAEAFARLTDGELGLLFVMLVRPAEHIAQGIQDGTIQTDPPGVPIILTAEVLAEAGKVRETVLHEIARRALPDED